MNIIEIIYINLWTNFIRRRHITKLFRFQSLPCRRMAGVYYSEGRKKFDKYLKTGVDDYLKADKNGRINGAISCWIAHAKVLESITSKTGLTLVVEDDFSCQSNFLDVALGIVNSFDREFDILICDPQGEGPRNTDKISDEMYLVKGTCYPLYYGSHCLFVNNSKVNKILDSLYNTKIKDYDSFLLDSMDLNIYIFYTGLSETIKFGSNISGKGNIRSINKFLGRMRFL